MQHSGRSCERSERTLRRTAGCFFVGGALMLVAGFISENPLMVLSGVLQGIAWWSFATCANRKAQESGA